MTHLNNHLAWWLLDSLLTVDVYGQSIISLPGNEVSLLMKSRSLLLKSHFFCMSCPQFRYFSINQFLFFMLKTPIQLSASQRKFTRRASSNSLVVRESSKLSCKKCSRWTLKRGFFARLLEMFRWRYQCFNVFTFSIGDHSFFFKLSIGNHGCSFNFCIGGTRFFGAFFGMEIINMLWHLDATPNLLFGIL